MKPDRRFAGDFPTNEEVVHVDDYDAVTDLLRRMRPHLHAQWKDEIDAVLGPHCGRCGQVVPPGCGGAQHGNRGCALNNPSLVR